MWEFLDQTKRSYDLRFDTFINFKTYWSTYSGMYRIGSYFHSVFVLYTKHLYYKFMTTHTFIHVFPNWIPAKITVRISYSIAKSEFGKLRINELFMMNNKDNPWWMIHDEWFMMNDPWCIIHHILYFLSNRWRVVYWSWVWYIQLLCFWYW